MTNGLDEYKAQLIVDTMIDIAEPVEVEIRIGHSFNGQVVWVNVNDVCKFRAKVSNLKIIDERPLMGDDEAGG